MYCRNLLRVAFTGARVALIFAPPAPQLAASEADWADRSYIVLWALAGKASARHVQAW